MPLEVLGDSEPYAPGSEYQEGMDPKPCELLDQRPAIDRTFRYESLGAAATITAPSTARLGQFGR